MYRLQVKDHFDAAHSIRDYEGKCNRLHGHRWEVEVVVDGAILDRRNMLVDFSEVKGLLKEVIDSFLDHWHLNSTLKEPNVTAEYLAHWIYYRLEPSMKGLTGVTIWESPECCVEYFEERSDEGK